MMDQLYADAHLMQRLSSSRPALADAIRSRDVNAFQVFRAVVIVSPPSSLCCLKMTRLLPLLQAALRETSRAQREAEEKQRQELAVSSPPPGISQLDQRSCIQLLSNPFASSP